MLAKQIYEKYMWDTVFKNGPREICGRQPLKNLKGYGLLPIYALTCMKTQRSSAEELQNSARFSGL